MRRLGMAGTLLVLTVVVHAETHTVEVNADGTFSPAETWIHDGDTVKWVFHDRTDTIIPVNRSPAGKISHRPYVPGDPNEFTGPMPFAPSGVFTLGPDGRGFEITTRDELGRGRGSGRRGPRQTRGEEEIVARVGDRLLTRTGAPYASMDWTWAQPGISGVYIRVRWNTVHRGPDDFDWTVMDREIEKAVRHGKLYSLSFKAGREGTPEWIFREGVKRLTFQDGGSQLEDGKCGVIMDLGSPADPNYRKHYFALLNAAAKHIRERNAWYRALAYIKPSGANLHTAENRLPNRCNRDDGCVCNPEVWAREGGYTPRALYEFYSEQTGLLAKEFPGKAMSYMLIQAGFPRVGNDGKYEGQPGTRLSELPTGIEQTEHVLAQGRREHGIRFVVQHNALSPGERINPWVRGAGDTGSLTGLQTTNVRVVNNPKAVEGALRNAWENSNAVFVEIYEERFWEAQRAGPGLDSAAAVPRTVGDWTERFHERRRNDWPNLPDPFPISHSHTFKRTIGPSEGQQLFYYVNGSKYGNMPTAGHGVIGLLPDK
jgi:hypothetical protein